MQRTFKLIAKTQANGVQTMSLSGYERAQIHQVQVDLSAIPANGTLDIAIRTPGAENYNSIGDVDLVNGPYIVYFEAYCDAIQFTPTDFDLDKNYSVNVFCLQV
jgi:hypothetical protein